MLDKILYTRSRVVLLILFLICFFDFEYLPATLSLKPDWKLFCVLVVILVLGIGLYKHYVTSFSKRLNYLLALLFVFAIINCISCYYYRQQSLWITFIHWSPIFLLYLYYPFSALNFSVKSWERILFSIFVLIVIVEIVQNVFSELHLFRMTSGNEKFDMEFRVRVYCDSLLYIGSLFCLNKALVMHDDKWKYWILYIISITLILLCGFRMLIFSNLLSSLIMLFRIKRMSVKTIIIISALFVSIFGVLQTSTVRDRMVEIEERMETANFDNDDYVRLLTLNYYLHDYFKSPIEMFWGSGLVQRMFKTEAYDVLRNDKYESNYSRNVSETSVRYHFYPVDWGLLGFSWEGGIPATILLILITIMLIFSKVDIEYLYLSSWGIMVILSSLTNPLLYYHHSLIYTTVLLVICNKLYIIKKFDTYIKK